MAATSRITIYVTQEEKQRIYAAAKASKFAHASMFARMALLRALGPSRLPAKSED